MKKLLILTVCVLLCWSCTRTVYVPVTATHDEHVVMRDTVIEIHTVAESLYRETCDTVSILTGERAESRAVVKDGVLSHTLTVNPRTDTVAIRWREVHVIDSIPYPFPVEGKTVEVIPSWIWWILALLLLLFGYRLICR